MTERSELAQQAYEALCALDPEDAHSERQRLRAAGVAEVTIVALYPSALEGLIPGLIEHLDAHGTSHVGRALIKAAGEERMAISKSKVSWPPGMAEAWLDQSPLGLRPDTPEIRRLLTYLDGPLDPRDSAEELWYSTISVLWSSWWLMERRALLSEEAAQQVDGHMLWLVENLTPKLIADFHGRLEQTTRT